MSDENWSREPEKSSSSEMNEAMQDALGGTPPSVELEQMLRALDVRKQRLQSDLDISDDEAEREHLRREMAQIDEHIAILREEADINRFVEDAVRVSQEMRKLSEG
jgi:hypothetical protein